MIEKVSVFRKRTAAWNIFLLFRLEGAYFLHQLSLISGFAAGKIIKNNREIFYYALCVKTKICAEVSLSSYHRNRQLYI